MGISDWSADVCSSDLGLVESRLGAAQRSRSNVEPAAVEAGHGDPEAIPFLTQSVGNRTACAIQHDSPRRLGMPAHLPLIGTEGKAGRIEQEERRVGNECVGPYRTQWSQANLKKKKKT